ncbi:hypothetical protein AB0F71_06565 [Kitasatospora sp. NPDC028055]|uniref:hypothetical protein n=1 Tax=Kitasatospora sp. NPDC028055 TaxID=3155653 RepID=UPI0033CDF333
MSVHHVRRYVPLAVWKWAFIALVLLFWLLIYHGILWQGLVVDAVVLGGLVVIGQLPPSVGLRTVEVRPEGLWLRFARTPDPMLLGWADILDVSYRPGYAETRRSGGREVSTFHHTTVALLVRGREEPLVLVHVRRSKRLALLIASHAARARARAAGLERRDGEGV